MSEELELKLRSCESRLMASSIDGLLSLQSKKEVPSNVELREARLHLKVGRIEIAYSYRSFRCSPGVWFQTILLQLFGKGDVELKRWR